VGKIIESFSKLTAIFIVMFAPVLFGIAYGFLIGLLFFASVIACAFISCVFDEMKKEKSKKAKKTERE
jgi:hypothetical protein